MNYGLLKSIVTMAMISAGAFTFAIGIINTFAYDIFAGCVNGEYEPTSGICQYGPQISINVLGMLTFFLVSYVMLGTGKRTPQRTLLWLAGLSIVYFFMLTFIWRLQVALEDNFFFFAGPQTFLEYLFVLYRGIDVILVGIALGVIAWLPGRVDAHAIDASKRREVRAKYSKK